MRPIGLCQRHRLEISRAKTLVLHFADGYNASSLGREGAHGAPGRVQCARDVRQRIRSRGATDSEWGRDGDGARAAVQALAGQPPLCRRRYSKSIGAHTDGPCAPPSAAAEDGAGPSRSSDPGHNASPGARRRSPEGPRAGSRSHHSPRTDAALPYVHAPRGAFWILAKPARGRGRPLTSSLPHARAILAGLFPLPSRHRHRRHRALGGRGREGRAAPWGGGCFAISRAFAGRRGRVESLKPAAGAPCTSAAWGAGRAGQGLRHAHRGRQRRPQGRLSWEGPQIRRLRWQSQLCFAFAQGPR